MSFRIEASGCFASRIGEGGVDEDAFAQALTALAPAIARFAAAKESGSAPLFVLPLRDDDLPPLREVAQGLLDHCEEIVILGAGGSSLGGQTLYALADRGFGPREGYPKLHFFDNVDPDTAAVFLERCNPRRLGVVAISKSGGTAETLCQTLVFVNLLRQVVGDAALRHRIAVITQPGASPLRALVERFDLPCLDHDPEIGGRFSVLSNVGMLPAVLAGLEAEMLRDGAARVLNATLYPAVEADAGPAAGAAIQVTLARTRGVSQTVLMPYIDRMARFAQWHRQLWAESLGKQGQGTTPIGAVGAVDQHSQLQLYLDGPWDKTFTLMSLDTTARGPRVPADLAREIGADYLAGRQMGDLLEAEARATAETLIRNGRPTRRIELDDLDEETLGGLFMHFMLETLLAAELFAVDPYGQPAVEEGKRLTRDYLAQSGAAS